MEMHYTYGMNKWKDSNNVLFIYVNNQLKNHKM